MFIRDVLGCPNYASIPPNMVRTYFHPHQWLIVERSHDHAMSVKLPKQTPPVLPKGVKASETSPRFLVLIPGCDSSLPYSEFQSHVPELQTPLSERVRAFLDWLQDNRAFSSIVHVVK